VRKQLGEILTASGAVTEEQLREALAVQNNRSLPLGRILVEQGAADEATVWRALAKQARLPFVDLEGRTPPGRIAGLDRVLHHMTEKGAVWFARRDEIARHWLERLAG